MGMGMFTRLRYLNFSIGGRIFLGFGIVVSLLVGQAVIVEYGVNDLVANFTRYDKTQRGVRAILEIERNVLDLHRGAMAFSYSGYRGVADQVRELQQILGQQIHEVGTMVTDAKRHEVLQRITRHFELYVDTFKAAIEERLQQDLTLEHLQALGNQMDDALHGQLKTTENPSAEMAMEKAHQLLLFAQRDSALFRIKPNSKLVRNTQQHLTRMLQSLEQLATGLIVTPHRDQVQHAIKLAQDFETAFLGMVQATRAYLHLTYVVMSGEATEITHLTKQLKELTLREQIRMESLINDEALGTRRTIEGSPWWPYSWA